MTRKPEPDWAVPMHHHHRDTMAALFAHPTSSNIRWVDVLSLVGAIGSAEERDGRRYRVTIGARTELFERESGKDLTVQQVIDLRHMIEAAAPRSPGWSEELAVAAIDFREARIFSIDDSAPPVHVASGDPKGLFHRIHTKAGDPAGKSLTPGPEYWQEIAHALRGAQRILLLGHGQGKSNAAERFAAWARDESPEIAAHLVAVADCDLGDLSDARILRLAQGYFRLEPVRRTMGG